MVGHDLRVGALARHIKHEVHPVALLEPRKVKQLARVLDEVRVRALQKLGSDVVVRGYDQDGKFMERSVETRTDDELKKKEKIEVYHIIEDTIVFQLRKHRKE